MKKMLDVLVKAETVAASIILAALIICTFVGVIARYVFSSPFTWEEEFQLACMVWITFLAAPVAFHTKSHVAIEILVDAFPKKVKRIAEGFIVAAMYVILIYFFFRSLDFLGVIAGTSRATPILKIPYAGIYAVAPVSIVLMLVSYTYMTIKGALDSRKAEQEQEGGAQ